MMTAPPTSDLTGWRSEAFTGAGITHDCYEKGAGPGVVLIPEVPGITPEVLGGRRQRGHRAVGAVHL